MRKFNLKGTVIQRMKGIPKEEDTVVKDTEKLQKDPHISCQYVKHSWNLFFRNVFEMVFEDNLHVVFPIT